MTKQFIFLRSDPEIRCIFSVSDHYLADPAWPVKTLVGHHGMAGLATDVRCLATHCAREMVTCPLDTMWPGIFQQIEVLIHQPPLPYPGGPIKAEVDSFFWATERKSQSFLCPVDVIFFHCAQLGSLWQKGNIARSSISGNCCPCARPCLFLDSGSRGTLDLRDFGISNGRGDFSKIFLYHKSPDVFPGIPGIFEFMDSASPMVPPSLPWPPRIEGCGTLTETIFCLTFSQ